MFQMFQKFTFNAIYIAQRRKFGRDPGCCGGCIAWLGRKNTAPWRAVLQDLERGFVPWPQTLLFPIRGSRLASGADPQAIMFQIEPARMAPVTAKIR